MIQKVSAIIVAAGDGTRMGGVSKPLILLNGITVFEHVLQKFIRSKYIDEIVVACKDTAELESIAAKYRESMPITLVQGGATRNESVNKAFCATDKDTRIIVIHDCARPLVLTETINEIIEAAFRSGAATASTPVTDTIKYIDEDKVKTPKRSALKAVQTPQVFNKDVYSVALALAKKNNYIATDDTTLVEKAGFKVTYVDCPVTNIKLTTPSDVVIANTLIGGNL
ncbi:MAG: 2-C-methyl-D-erythritol 4-phosphate cytidylyltransferase [Clostridiales bacterium GWF2_38_85]|nr:MAG: 2-C-methyl-D-erythritol 4-phosphate cytidylyltransferase [Clostridiales bacterium GWF2_38_85]HBL83576.1 2-C-methyl-D-erythritol 4-phosphate cytidylyltransferase [Clostridiales bacterium]